MTKIRYMPMAKHTHLYKILSNMQCIIPIVGQKQCHPNDDEHGITVTKKRMTNT